MNSFRKWLYKPKKTDKSLLAQFYYADDDLNTVAAELDSFDGRKDPERCAALVAKLRSCQDKVLGILEKVMADVLKNKRASRDFRVKFPDDVLQESLAGQLWFGAECLAAGSSIMNRELESCSMRPLARALTKNLDCLRCILRDQCLRTCDEYSDRIKEALVIFDKLFAEFEFSYVSAMVPVKSKKEYECVQEITVLFSETLQRALKFDLLKQEMVDDYDPALMFTIPRLAIVSGLLVFGDGPLCPDAEASSMSEIFRPFQSLLFKIRELLLTLNEHELYMLEKVLCSNDESILNSLYPPDHFQCSEDTSSQCNSKNLGAERQNSFQDVSESSLDEFLDTSVVVHSPKLQHSNSDHFSIGQMSHSSSTVTVIQGQRSFDSENSPDEQVSAVKNSTEDLGSRNDTETISASALSSPDLANPQASNTDSSKSDLEGENIPKELKEVAADKMFKSMPSSSSAQGDQVFCKDCASVQCKNCSIAKTVTKQASSRSSGNRYRDGFNSGKETCDSSNKRHADSCDKIHPRHSSDTTSNTSLSLKNKKFRSSQSAKSPCKSFVQRKRTSIHTDYHSKAIDYPSDSESSTCSTCVSDNEWDNESQETSSYSSECNDDEEINLALQAAELASRSEARSRFRSSSDLIHRLFVCISGVADQLQTNYASDLRNILKAVFDINCTDHVIFDETAKEKKERGLELPSHDSYRSRNSNRSTQNDVDRNRRNVRCGRGAPLWVPDELTSHCTSCKIPFTFIKRRHHCRNCGQIYCNKCSGNIVPLPHYGLTDPVRVCNRCYMYHVSPFTVGSQ